MAISPYIARLRERIGHDVLLVPAVAVLPADPTGRLLLVRQIDTETWATIGGSIEPDESPADAARREALEEAGIEVDLGPVRAVLGGPEFRARYPNGDQTSVVSIVYDATILGGTPRPDHDETDDVRWFTPQELPGAGLNLFATTLLRHLAILPAS